MALVRAIYVLAMVLCCAGPAVAQSGDAALRQAIAAAVAQDPALAQFYSGRDHAPIWVGDNVQDRRRVSAFLDALGDAGDHGLPVQTYRRDEIDRALRATGSVAERAEVEALMSRSFAAYARDVQSGVLDPNRVSREIDRAAPRKAQAETLAGFASSSPAAFLRTLPPQTEQYARLLAERARLEGIAAAGGWGPKVGEGTLKPGQSSAQVPALRARLAAMGYGRPGSDPAFDAELEAQVTRFQRDHGLAIDGVVGPATLAEVNRTAAERLAQVFVTMERERWMNFPLGQRYVWVNIPDYHVRLVEDGRQVFETRSVVGQNRRTHRTPEFSDVMEFMVINPTWNVPRSITTREYLPMLQRDPNAVAHLQLLDSNGNRVSRAMVDFASYDAGSFPYRLKEPPNDSNALGLVKFMFPNRHNIYLHDTPHKSLFSRDTRAYSHGCVRLADPFDFAYALLRGQTATPEAFFAERLNTGRETTVMIENPPRVHIVYRTVIAQPRGPAQFRPDIYGRDAQIFDALSKAGVSLRAVGG
ncbi:L,D-transpeptidase family protein [Meridianimarinicoccus sp. RP-17]|uniref:L,D-transpeptidase family protein n=1 Tax=Meridianimarinicoccus zhengii TaxID=2056810 RepID=UPI001EED74A5|nr:L,D-transpeptidase family protein [Phycocomes zhengii]